MSYNPFEDLPGEVAKGIAMEEGKDMSSTEPAIKRKRVESNGGIVNVDVAESKEDNQALKTIKSEANTQGKVVDVLTTLQALQKHILNVKKQSKALQLLFNLAESELNGTVYATEFFYILQKFVTADTQHDVSQNSSGTPLALAVNSSSSLAGKVIDLFMSRRNCFSHLQDFEMQNWYLLYSVRNSLCCDDSFKFSKACQVVSDLFDCSVMFPAIMTVDYSQEGGGSTTSAEDRAPTQELKRGRVTATLQCLRAAKPLYARAQWAKQPLDKLVSTVVQRRLQLDADQRAQLDDLSTSFTLAKRKAVSGKPTQTVRSINSTAHPLQTKKMGILR